ncbi:Beta-ketoacyl synthase [Streptomyces iranensis]|uniref:Beta-ketoacyl synthase n=1 Tax=Streptomyces iranensis TaxID=576784 RepID=A0A060ZCY7_9ACTN|nr:Beta-ketoacyl synthase [Streptomyces iranensis]
MRVGPELDLPEATDEPVLAWAEPADLPGALALVQAWLEAAYPAGSRLAVRTRDAVAAAAGDTVAGLPGSGVWGLVRSAMAEHPDAGLALLDDDGRPESAEIVGAALATGEKELALRTGAVLVPRLRPVPAVPELPTGPEAWRLEWGPDGDLDDVRAVSAPDAERPLAPGEVRIALRAAGVNFRDVLQALGMLPNDLRMSGGEGAGVVTETGPGVDGLAPGMRVMGMFQGFGPLAVVDARLVVPVPDEWSDVEAAGVPVAYLTAYHALFDLGHVQPGDRVLIHAAAGGVGMAAVHLALAAGAEVFATASPAKQAAVAALGVTHIASSRTADFADEFGQVDVVLNSLTGELLDASLGMLAEGGRFVELGKIDIRDPRQVPFDLGDLDPDRVAAVWQRVLETAVPLPVTVFPAAQAGAALRFMSQARHVGKIVLRLPGVDDGAVLITGGTGTLGGLVARHLVVRHGVRDLVLASRSGLDAPGAVELVAGLEAVGARVRVVAADLSDRVAVDALVAGISGLVGVVHAAGVLRDAPVASLTGESLDLVVSAKAEAAWHLHEATVGRDLRMFVLFSSLAGLLGNPGQGNYAAANAYLDALAAYRTALGLPAVSIAWGLWEQSSGMTGTLTEVDRARLARGGGAALPTEQALRLLDAAVAGREPVVAAGLDVSAIRSAIASGAVVPAALLGLGRAPRRAVAARTGSTSALARRLGGLGEAERSLVLLELVREHAAVVLGHGDDEGAGIPADRAFRDLGFDSLTAVELRNRLAAASGLTLPATLVFDYPTPRVLAEYLLAQVTGAAPAEVKAAPAPVAVGEPVAIVSMACRFPGGVASPEDLWRLVANNVDAMGDFPADRGWETESAGYARVGGFLSGAADFDAEFFGISPREAVAMDPQQRLLLEVSWEALERAGVDPAAMKGTDTGVFAGLASQGYDSLLAEGDGSGFRMTGNTSSVASGRVSYVLGLEGPAVTVDTACSSSLVAMHLAAQALRNGECSLALAGGVTVMPTPGTFAEFALQDGLAADGRVKAYSAAADGTNWAEGVGVLVLERLSEAQRLGHPVLAVLRGSAVNQDGASNGLTAPNGPSQERVIRAALAGAKLSASDVDVVEGHGTGTTLGDPIEARALLAAYGQDRPEERPLWLGSVKSNIGHTQAAAGAAGVIKMVEALQRGVLPATLYADEPSPHIDWSAGEVRLLTEARPWESDGRPRRAGVSSFGVSGTNAHLILEQAPDPVPAPVTAPGPARPLVADVVVPWVLSARSEAGLHALASEVAGWAGRNPDAGAADVAVSLAGSRAGLEYRAVVLGADRAELDEALRRVEPGRAADSGGVAFVFPGQGSQWLGMGRELLACSPVFAEFVAECEQFVDWPLRDALVSGAGLDRGEVIQPALFVMMVGLARVWEAAGVVPSAVVGHSQGELAAACFAGALSLEDALRLVTARGTALQSLAGTAGLVSVAAGPDVVEPLLRDGLEIAAINSASSVVVVGAPGPLEAFTAQCETAGIRARRVETNYASHHPVVEPIREAMLAVRLTPRTARMPFYSAVTGTAIDGASLDAGYWWRNLREQVKFAQTVAAVSAAGFIEVSPHPVLAHLVEGRWAVGSLRRDDGGQRRLLASLADAWIHGANVDWTRVVPEGSRVTLPTYPFQHRRYWASGGGTSRGNADHPLLDHAVRLAEESGWAFSGRVSTATSAWLADHAVSGTVLVPGAALTELVLHAGDRAGLPAIGEITFEQPLVLVGRPVDVQVRVDGQQAGVYSRAGEQWIRHATAALADPAGTVTGLDGQWPPAGAQPLPVGDVYDVMAARGYEYGPAFRGLQAAWRLGEDLYAEVELPVGDGQEKFGIHPALLDATLHVLIAGADDSGDNGDGAVRMPFAWRDVRLHATGASALRVRLSPAGPDAFSLLAADGEGQPVVSAGAMISRPADTGRLAAPGAGEGLLALEWAPVSPPEPGAEEAWVPVGPELELPEARDEPVYAWAEPAHATGALALVRAWLGAGYPAGSRLAVRTRDAVAAAAGDTVAGLAHAGVWGLVRSAMAEHPDAGLVLLDDDGRPESDAFVVAALATGEKELALRDGVVLVPRLRRVESDDDAVPVLDPEGTVLITGGTSTVGALVARHLATRHGVRSLVLVSRSGPDAPGAAELTTVLETLGARVRIVAADLSDRAAVDALVADVPELSGVVHADGVLEDAPITSLDEASLGRVLAAKADTAQHLHEATGHLDLRMFVLFSSLSGLLGNAGQGNYAAANTYLDALAAHRMAEGLPAVSIAWGRWEEQSDTTDANGTPMPSEHALNLLDRALNADGPVLAAGLDLSSVRSAIAAGSPLPAVLGGLVRVPRRAAASGPGASQFARQMAALGEAERARVLLDLVRENAAAVLGHDQAADVRADRAFRDIGFDSITAVELRNRLATATGLTLPATLVFDHPTAQALAEYVMRRVSGVEESAAEVVLTRSAGEPVAIVGMACRYPGGVASPEDLWRVVADGVDAMGAFPADRGWETDSAGYVQVGGFLSGAGDFDAEFFGISPREALAMDPQQRLLLEVVWEALERAGLDPSAMKGTDTGVFAGMAMQDYSLRLSDGGAGFGMTGNASSVASGRLAYTFGLEGPAVTVDTACSSSLVATHLAVQALRNGECSLALAGGATVLATPAAFAEFEQQGALASDGRSKAFSAAADGMGMSEGIGVLVLERLSEAQRLGHPVLAVLRGSAVNQDGASNGLTAPNGPSQERVIRRALADARLTPVDVDAVEAHGTGTALGDPIEAQALLAAYGQDRPEDRPLWLGSLKSNIGHTVAGAGVGGVIKMVEALRHRTLPATLHADEPSPHVDWTAGDMRLLTEARPWESTGRPRRAGVSSFGISGTNAHVIVEEAPAAPAPSRASDPVVTGGLVPWVLSARSEAALQALAARLASDVPVDTPVADVAVSLAGSRAGLEYRAVVLGADRAELDEALTRVEPGRAADSGGVAFVFPGQGSQWLGMGRELLACSPVFAEFVAECERLVDWPLRDALVSGVGMDQVEVVQPALFVMMVGLARVWEAAGVVPSAVVGHSQGELAAACFAGALSLEDALGLVTARGRALRALAGTGGMVSVSAAPDVVEGLLRDGLRIAAVNADSQVVVSGAPAPLESLVARCESAGIRARRVEVDYASHHPLVEAVREDLLAVEVTPRTARVPFYSAVTGTAIDTATLDAGYWWRNLREQVKFAQTVAGMPVEGFVEVSPHPVLMQGIEGRWAVGSLRRDDGGQRRLLASLADAWTHGATVDWARLTAGGRPVTLPTYPFQHRRYWASGGGVARGDTGHQLLGSAVRLAEDAGWVLSGRVSTATSPWLADHAVSGTVLVPGAALAELVLHAGDRAGLPAIAEITFEQPLVLGGSPVDVQVSVEGGQAGVFSRTGEQWIRHATATLADPEGTVAGLEGQWPPAGAQPLPVSDAYADIAARGYEYGPAFRGLQAAWRLGEDVYAEVELPAAAAEGLDGFGIHPALLDAALHALLVAAIRDAVGDSDQVLLPFGWRDVRLHATGASALRVRLSPAGPDAFSLLAADGEGQPVISAGAIISRPADTSRLGAAPAAGAGLLSLEWAPISLGPAPEEAWDRVGPALPDAVGRPVLAWADPADVSAALALVQAWLGAEYPAGSRLAVRTRDAVAAAPGDTVAGLAEAGIWGLVRSAQSEHPDAGLVLLDDDGRPGSDAVVAAALATGEREMALRDGAVLVPRLRPVPNGPELPMGEGAWRLQWGPDGDLDEVRAVPAPDAERPLEPHEIRIAVRVAGVNFRDVVSSLGMLPGDPRPPGGEGTGVVVETGSQVRGLPVGTRVMGMFAAFGPLAVIDARLVAPVPDGWSDVEAAGVATAYLTAYHALFDLGRVRSGDRVLIHAASGGVGTAAVRLALAAGAQVFATASPPKQAAVAELGVTRIASSRTADFAAEFGQVDVVLNSLTGELLDASLGMLAEGGRFVELGKIDIRDPRQVPFDLADLDPDRLAVIWRRVLEQAVPLPVTVFPAAQAGAALRYMSQARHVGKIVLRMPGVGDGTVLITGGTGTLGGMVARHLVVRHGVRDLVLASRSGPDAPGAAELTTGLAALGARVRIVAADLSDRVAVDALVAGVPELVGVVHATGVLEDTPVTSLTGESLGRVLAAKADAARYLHEATRDRDLRTFVLFSSLSGLLGNPGQGNYAAANAYLDALAAHRMAEGLPAVSIAWGMWEQTSGMTAALTEADRARQARSGGVVLSTEQALALLDRALGLGRPVLAAGLDVGAIRQAIAAGTPVPTALQGLGRAPRRAAVAGAGGGALARRLAQLPPGEHPRVVLDLVREHAAVVLGHSDDSGIEADQAFRNLGFDSLTAVELRNRLAVVSGLTLPATLVFDYPTPQDLAEYLVAQVTGAAAAAEKAAPAPAAAGEPIAIVSMACRYPGGVASPEDLWRLVRDGEDAVGAFPDDRGWDLSAIYDPTPGTPGRVYTREGGFLDGVADFDPVLFGVSPREALAMDPQQRLLLEVVWEALERAGLDPTAMKGTDTAVYAGLAGQDYAAAVAAQQGAEGYLMTGNASSVASGRVAYTFGFEGPAVTIDTACSSSLVAMHLAAQALRSGECSLAVAGGVTVMSTPGPLAELAMQRAISAVGRSKSFSEAADGMGMSEGVGVVLLERLSEARRLGHPVLAVLRGSAVNQDGASNGLSAPNGPAQERVIRRALADARLSGSDVDAAEGHGTGTHLGDTIEAQAMLATYGQDRPEERPLWLGSVKSNIGHTQAASGVAGVIKMVEAMRHGTLPATLHVDEPSRQIDWSAGDVRLLTEARPWESDGRPRRVGVSTFGISGTNAHVILEQAPAAPVPPGSDTPAQSALGDLVPWAVSARTDGALRALAADVADWAGRNQDVPAADVAASLAANRVGFRCRAVVWAADREDLVAGLRSVAEGQPVAYARTAVTRPGRVAFLFPGAESSWPGMALRLAERSAVFADALQEAQASLEPLIGSEADARRREEHAGVFAVEVALAALLRSYGLRPDFLLGDSVGEVAAAYLAGVFSLADAGRLVVARAGGTGLRETVEQIAFSAPSIPVVSAVTGKLLDPSEIASPGYWSRPAETPDGLEDGVRLLRDRGVTGFLEVGPDGVLSPAVSGVLADVDDRGWVTSVLLRDQGDASRVLSFLAEAYVNGASVDWTAVSAGSGRRRAGLPTYPFQRRRFWPAPAAAGAHPLLGTAVELADPAQRWFGRTDATPVLSAGARADWAVAAARAVGAPAALRDLVFPEPATESVGPAAVQTAVRTGAVPMRIGGYVRASGASGAGWTAYLDAEIAEPEPAGDLPDRADGGLIQVTGDSAAEVLDGCLRLAAAGGSVAGAERLELFDDVPAEVWCRVRGRGDLSDLDLVSADGAPVARITGLRFHRTATA